MNDKSYLYINSNNNLVHANKHTVDIVGEKSFFEQRMSKGYWLVDRTDKQSILNALSKALEKDVNQASLYWIVTSFEYKIDDIKEYLGGAGLKIEKNGESSWSVTDGTNNVVGATPLIAFLSWYSEDFEENYTEVPPPVKDEINDKIDIKSDK